MAHLHSIYDSDLHFKIDPFTRVISRQAVEKSALIQFDHNSERFTFEIPRYVEGHDMSRCTRVEVHYLNIESNNENTAKGIYEVEDLQISPNDPEVVICSWLISNNATQYAGTLNFVLRFACDDNYVWNTAPYKNYPVLSGIYNSEEIVTAHADVLEQWYKNLFTENDNAVKNIAEARAMAISEIESAAEQKKQAVLDSIPDDYITLAEDVAPPIIEQASGGVIAITDSANRKLRGMKLYGKSTQNGTPTPDNPIDIVSVENPTVSVCGKNLFNINAITSNSSITNNGDGTITVTKVVSQPSQIFQKVCPFLKVGDVATFSINSPAIDKTNLDADLAFIYLTGAKVSWKNGQTKTITQEMLDGYIYFYSSKDENANGVATVISEIQVERGSVATPYEPYTEQTLTLTRTLPGIPVASGGNYTDENGKQWICDEVDFERGMYVQRVYNNKFTDFSGANSYSYDGNGTSCAVKPDKNLVVHHGFCSHFVLTHLATTIDRFNVTGDYIYFKLVGELTREEWVARMEELSPTVVAVLESPIETVLTAEELAAYAALRSNYPHTSIINDGGAEMSVKYVADTKLYIDKKIGG